MAPRERNTGKTRERTRSDKRRDRSRDRRDRERKDRERRDRSERRRDRRRETEEEERERYESGGEASDPSKSHTGKWDPDRGGTTPEKEKSKKERDRDRNRQREEQKEWLDRINKEHKKAKDTKRAARKEFYERTTFGQNFGPNPYGFDPDAKVDTYDPYGSQYGSDSIDEQLKEGDADRAAEKAWDEGRYDDWLDSKMTATWHGLGAGFNKELDQMINNPLDYLADLSRGPLGLLSNVVAPGLSTAIAGLDTIVDYYQGEGLGEDLIGNLAGDLASTLPGIDPLAKTVLTTIKSPEEGATMLGGMLGGKVGAGIGGTYGGMAGSILGSLGAGAGVSGGLPGGTGTGGRPDRDRDRDRDTGSFAPEGAPITTTTGPAPLRPGYVMSDPIQESARLAQELPQFNFQEIANMFPAVDMSTGRVGGTAPTYQPSPGFRLTPTGQVASETKIMIDPQIPDPRGYSLIQEGGILNRMIEPIPVLQ